MTALSRTDKTAPWRVKVFYYPTWVEEMHDHINGVCDLPPRPTRDNVDWFHRGSCGWVYSMEFMRSSMARCACKMCGRDAYEKMPRRRRQRIEGKRYTRGGWLKEY